MSSKPILICMPVILLSDPAVPSTLRACERCKQQVWMSEDSNRVFGQGATIICTPCAGTLPKDNIQTAITEETRQRLRDMGLTDEYINLATQVVAEAISQGDI